MKRFTTAEDIFIRDNYKTMTLKEMSEVLVRNQGSISGRMARLGYRIDAATKKARFSHSNLVEKGKAFRFKKGHTPANKGKQMPEYVVAKTRATQFKKGITPHNLKPVGSERVTKDGYIEVKVQEPRKWQLKHRLVWEMHNEPLKHNDVIKFRDGNKLNTTIDNLLLTDRVGNMIDNSIMNYPTEVRKTIHTIAKLNRTIKKKENESN